ncbi:hypothetical protein F4808DRAFT_468222 [Astrocystis sublimbata]|nr:hypothetical protein F4808DRAFT_468222 [Astrocystis sublimbata]
MAGTPPNEKRLEPGEGSTGFVGRRSSPRNTATNAMSSDRHPRVEQAPAQPREDSTESESTSYDTPSTEEDSSTSPTPQRSPVLPAIEQARRFLAAELACDTRRLDLENIAEEFDKMQRQLLSIHIEAEKASTFLQDWSGLRKWVRRVNNCMSEAVRAMPQDGTDHQIYTKNSACYSHGLMAKALIANMQRQLGILSCWVETTKMSSTPETTCQESILACERTARAHDVSEEINSANPSPSSFPAHILDQYRESSRLYRVITGTRIGKVQKLLDETLTDVNRLRAEMTFQQDKTGDMIATAKSWQDGLKGPTPMCYSNILELLPARRFAFTLKILKLDASAEIIRELSSLFDFINPELEDSANHRGEEASADSEDAIFPMQDTFAGYIEALEARLKQQKVDEDELKVWEKSLECREEAVKQKEENVERENKALEFRRELVKNVIWYLPKQFEMLQKQLKQARRDMLPMFWDTLMDQNGPQRRRL